MPEYLETTVDKFIFRVATDRLYSTEGVWVLWVEPEGNGRVRVGLTDYLQQLNGDVAFAHVKPVGTRLAAGDEFAEIETIKATLILYSPVEGEIVEVNPAPRAQPGARQPRALRQGLAGGDPRPRTGRPTAQGCSIRRPTWRPCGPRPKRS